MCGSFSFNQNVIHLISSLDAIPYGLLRSHPHVKHVAPPHRPPPATPGLSQNQITLSPSPISAQISCCPPFSLLHDTHFINREARARYARHLSLYLRAEATAYTVHKLCFFFPPAPCLGSDTPWRRHRLPVGTRLDDRKRWGPPGGRGWGDGGLCCVHT